MNRLLPILLLLTAIGGGPARAAIVPGQTVQVGHKQFSNFTVVPANLASAIDVAPDPSGAGIRFTTAALAINGGGDLVVDVTFNVATSPGFAITSVSQAFTHVLSQGLIWAYNFTTVSAPSVNLHDCVTTVANGCTVASFVSQPIAATTALTVKREVQLQQSRQGGAPSPIETVSSFDTTFVESVTATPITVTTNPAGLSISVDGAIFTAPQNFSWTPGSNHTIATSSTQGTGTRQVFASWSDSGIANHTVTAPSTATTYTASFNTQYLLTTAVAPAAAGSIAILPTSTDGYYASGTSVQLTASASAGNQFSNWSGDLTAATNPVSVVMSTPRSVAANFTALSGVTVATSPTGLSITVDGVTSLAPQSFNWAPGSAHTIATSSASAGATRQVFAAWSDGGTLSHTVTAPAGATTYTANFTTQYLLTMSASPAAGGTVAASPASADGYYASGTSVQLTATATAGNQFTGWSGDVTSAANPVTVVLSAPRSVTANIGTLSGVTVTTNPPGLSILVDGANLTAPQVFSWTPGSSHTIAAVTPQATGGARQVFTNWSDLGTASHAVTAPSTPTTYTATFTTQYLLSAGVLPVAGGTIGTSPGAPAADGYYPAGASVQLTATARAGYQFVNWTGDLTGATNPQTVAMSAPRTVTANFVAVQPGITVTTNPPGLAIIVDGAALNPPQTFNWIPGTSHTIVAASTPGVLGTRQIFSNWSDGGTASHTVTAPAAATTYTANFTTQYLLITAASPGNAGSVAASPGSADGYYASGTAVQLTASASAGNQFSNWAGDLAGTANPQTVVVSAPRTVTASFSSLSGVTVATNPAGLGIVVDGASLIAPQLFNWVAGSTHTIATNSPQANYDARQVFANWNDGGAQTHSVTATGTAATYTANFNTQYLLTATASPAKSGSVTISPASADGYYLRGASVTLTAVASAGTQFTSWSGDLAGSANPQTVIMSTERGVTANFGTQSGVTVTTNPPGLSISVDGAILTAPQSFSWTAGSSHIIATTSPQGIGGTRQVFASWSDGGAASHAVAGVSGVVYTANFTTQYLLTTAASPVGGGTVIATPASADGYYASGATVQLTATASAANQFANWSGDLAGATNPQAVTMSSPRTVTASFSAARGVTLATNPPGLAIIVDGATVTAPQTFAWAAGSSHAIGVDTLQSGTGARFRWTNWSDQSAATHTIAAPSGAATYTASFTTEYLLTMSASPAAGGSVTKTPASADGYYAEGVSVQLAAGAAAGYQFGGWTGGLTGATNPQSVTMTGPLAVTATFTAPASTEPTIAAVSRGGSYKSGAISPGLIVTLWGDRMGPAKVVAASPSAEGKYPTVMAGTRALFDGVAAAVIFTSQQQASVIVPYGVDGRATVQLVVEYNGQRSAAYQLDVTDAAPGIFSADATGTGPGAILNLHNDGSAPLNTDREPAPRGSYISVYMTGEGQTNPRGVDGQVAVNVLPAPMLKVSATIGGVPATVQYAGGASYMVAGAMQVNLLVPADAPLGAAVPLVIQVGDKQTQAGITVAIGN